MKNATPTTTEGEVAFNVPSLLNPCKTWYKVIGEIGTAPALIVLHGGPGCAHEYMSGMAALHTAHGMPVVLYDQVGCGRSTHLRNKLGDADFWSFDLFFAELDNLIDHLSLRNGPGFDILGHSWGGTLGGAYASTRPRGLRKLAIYGGPCSIPLYIQGVQDWLSQLPEDVRETLRDCDSRGDHESEEFQKASAVWKLVSVLFICYEEHCPEECLLTMQPKRKACLPPRPMARGGQKSVRER
jgi:L-proline amide hydrolase